jgi:hypothetical protein
MFLLGTWTSKMHVHKVSQAKTSVAALPRALLTTIKAVHITNYHCQFPLPLTRTEVLWTDLLFMDKEFGREKK